MSFFNYLRRRIYRGTKKPTPKIKDNRDRLTLASLLDDLFIDLEGDLTTIYGKIDTIEGDIDIIEGDIDTLEDDIDTLEGITSLEDVTYSELRTLMSNEELIPGKSYRITNYRSVNYLNGYQNAYNYFVWATVTPTDPNFDPLELYYGDIEPLIVRAASTSKLELNAFSESHPRDIIEYLPEVDSIGLFWDLYSGGTTMDTSPLPAFELSLNSDYSCAQVEMPTGYTILNGHYLTVYAEFSGGADVISFVAEPIKDGEQYPRHIDSNNTLGTRFRLIEGGAKLLLLDVDNTMLGNYDTTTLFVQASSRYDLGSVGGDAYGWITRRHDTERNISMPMDFRGMKFRRFEVDLSALITGITPWYYGIGDDFRGEGTTGNYEDCSPLATQFTSYTYKDIFIEGAGGPETHVNYNGLADNFVLLQSSSDVHLGGRCYDSTYNQLTKVTIRGRSDYNNALQLQEVTANASFYNNNCNLVQYSEFSVSCNSNTFKTFNYNKVDIPLLAQDFDASTHVANSLTCYLTRTAAGGTTYRLFYLDATPAIAFDTITA